MKTKIISIILILSLTLLIFGCADSIKFDNANVKITDKDGNSIDTVMTITAEPYGLFCMDDKIEGVKYSPCVGNIVWGCILIETVIAPVVIGGWYFLEPTGLDNTKTIEIVN